MLSGKYDKSINSLSAIAKICIQTSIVLGVLVTITYCGTIDYYPSGLTIGDSLFFIAASLAFAITYTIIVLALMCAGITLSPFMRLLQSIIAGGANLISKLKNKPKIVGRINFPPIKADYILQILVGFMIFGINILEYYKDFNIAISLSLTIFSMAFIWGVWNTKPRRREYNEKSERKLKVSLAVITYLIPLVMIQAKGNFLNQSMSMIGVRVESSNIQVTKKYKEFLEANNNKPDKLTSSGDGIYEGAVIVFRGIGTNVVVKINDFNITIPANDIIIGT